MVKALINGLAILLCVPLTVLAQDFPSFLITPSKATITRNSAKSFRAVNKEGRAASEVRWAVSPSGASISGQGERAVAEFSRAGSYTVTAYGLEGSDSATVEVLDVDQLPEGTMKWSVQEFPGCKTTKIIPAVPSPSGVDVFEQEWCPYGDVVRALTPEGLELWRTLTSKRTAEEAAEGPPPGMGLTGSSLCDRVKVGMTKEEVARSSQTKSLKESDRKQDLWRIDEGEGECKITFQEGKVTKKQKVVAN